MAMQRRAASPGLPQRKESSGVWDLGKGYEQKQRAPLLGPAYIFYMEFLHGLLPF